MTGYGGWSWVSKTHVPRFIPRLPGNTNVNYRKALEGQSHPAAFPHWQFFVEHEYSSISFWIVYFNVWGLLASLILISAAKIKQSECDPDTVSSPEVSIEQRASPIKDSAAGESEREEDQKPPGESPESPMSGKKEEGGEGAAGLLRDEPQDKIDVKAEWQAGETTKARAEGPQAEGMETGISNCKCIEENGTSLYMVIKCFGHLDLSLDTNNSLSPSRKK